MCISKEMEDDLQSRFPHSVSFITRRLKEYDGSHDIEHARRVLQNSIALSSNTRSRPYICLAALAHDACDRKYGDTGELQQSLLNNLILDGVPFVRSLEVTDVVRHISFSGLRSHGVPNLQASVFSMWKVVSDADLLEALGIIGIVRTLMYQAWTQKPLIEAFDYIQHHLYHCFDYLQHDRAKQEGKLRLESMQAWMDQIHAQNPDYMFLSEWIYNCGTKKAAFLRVWTDLYMIRCSKCLEVLSQIEREDRFRAEVVG